MMEIVWTMLMSNIILGAMLGLIIWIDRTGISNMVKLKFMKGRALIILFGMDGKVTMTTTQIAGKNKDTGQIKINTLDYTLNRKKIRYYKSFPVLMYDEGIPEPLDVKSGEVSYGKLTPELLSQMLAMARQSGRLPKGTDRENLMFYLALVSAGAGAIAVFLIFSLKNDFGSAMNTWNSMSGLLTQIGQKILGG